MVQANPFAARYSEVRFELLEGNDDSVHRDVLEYEDKDESRQEEEVELPHPDDSSTKVHTLHRVPLDLVTNPLNIDWSKAVYWIFFVF